MKESARLGDSMKVLKDTRSLGEALAPGDWLRCLDTGNLLVAGRGLREWKPENGRWETILPPLEEEAWLPGGPRAGCSLFWRTTPLAGNKALLESFQGGENSPRTQISLSGVPPRPLHLMEVGDSVWGVGGGTLWRGQAGNILSSYGALPEGRPVRLWEDGGLLHLLVEGPGGEGRIMVYDRGGSGVWHERASLFPVPSSWVVGQGWWAGWSLRDRCLRLWDTQGNLLAWRFMPALRLTGLVRLDGCGSELWLFHHPYQVAIHAGPIREIVRMPLPVLT